MARKEKMITRTFKVTEACFMVIDVSDGNKIFDMVDTFNGHLSEKETLAAAREKWETKDMPVVTIKSFEHKEVLRGMPESQFLAYSVELPPRTSAEESTEETTEE